MDLKSNCRVRSSHENGWVTHTEPKGITRVATAQKSNKKPNILFIMGDDVGMWNISAYHRGMMGGRTPNIRL